MAVTVHVLTVHGFRHAQILFPRTRWLQTGRIEDVGTVVDHLKIAIDRDQIGLTVDLLVELAEKRRDVIHVDLIIGGDEIA